MKNKLLPVLIVILLMLFSFVAGGRFEKQKSNSSSISPTFPISPITPIQKLTVISVTDGDTVKLSDGRTFRLYGVNSPEIKEPYYQQAVDFTKTFVFNKEVSFEQEEKYKEDKFGRTLGYLFVEEKNLNVELVRNGLAKVVLYEKRAKIKYQDELLSAEKEAREKRIGVWNR